MGTLRDEVGWQTIFRLFLLLLCPVVQQWSEVWVGFWSREIASSTHAVRKHSHLFLLSNALRLWGASVIFSLNNSQIDMFKLVPPTTIITFHTSLAAFIAMGGNRYELIPGRLPSTVVVALRLVYATSKTHIPVSPFWRLNGHHLQIYAVYYDKG